MKEAVVGGLIRRHPAGRPAKAYMFCGTGLADILRTAAREGQTRSMTNPPRYGTGHDDFYWMSEAMG
ncbi:hypothetical protein F2Q70_00021441 [Brassica cretica]|uniref:Uncharacterized protein n=2 Tax=Brassica cretica TaxID=69181 RepID=A0A8S9HLC5_BRACR|nr:hypothetical protein F2Q70_00021441 [Brassica cretica]KAF2560071.1 hypothetical protein F2Q68_00014992 [Brassica cretica]KAF3610297.1 hypothetical protein DY000_02047734 [Brassica cretica]